MSATLFADGSVKSTGYDAAGRKIRETDQAGKITRFEYDAVGNLTAVVDALDNRTEYTYDASGNRLTQKDAENHTTSLDYDPLGCLVRKTYPNGNQERWGYDAAGNQVHHIKGNDSAAFEYDLLSREIRRMHYPSGHEVRTAYALDGKRDSVMDARGVTRFAYDDRGRLALEAQPNGESIESHYDAVGNRIRLVTRFGETRYRFDALNRMDSVLAPGNRITRYFYNAVGNRDSVVNANGATSAYAYDPLNRLKEVRNRDAGGALLGRYTYTLNAAGIRTDVDEPGGVHVAYGYDDLYRLTSEVRIGSNGYSRSFTYDDVGNRLTQVKGAATTSYTYNSRDQLVTESSASGTITYGYDPAGRLITKTDDSGTTTYAWVDDDRMESVSGPGVDVQYVYDADGRRVKETSGGAVKQYLIDRILPYGQVVLETDGFGAVNAEYVYGLERISQERIDGLSWYLADGQGSVRMLTDSTGAVTDTYDYTAFGEALAATGTTVNDFRYVGEQLDPNSGFYYNRARWMDPKGGRLLGVDPFEGGLTSPLSLHRYLYANTSPPNYIDPSGTMSLLQIQTTLVLAGIILKTFAPKLGSVINKVNPRFLIEGVKDTHNYLGFRDGLPVYVGISKDVVRRALEHSGRFTIKQMTSNPLYRKQAKAVEQYIMERNPHFLNKVSSVADSKSWYTDAMNFAQVWFYKNGADWGL